MPVDAHIAPIEAIERIITTMQTNYATDLADASVAVTDLPLPAPTADDYYPVVEQDDALNREMPGNVAVYVWQAQPLPTGAGETSLVSSSPSKSSEWVDVFISVMIACKQRQHPPITRLSKLLTTNDVMVERIHRYLGAAKLTLFKNACDETSFFQVDVSDDYLPQAVYDSAGQTERAYGTVTFRMRALINKKYSTA